MYSTEEKVLNHVDLSSIFLKLNVHYFPKQSSSNSKRKLSKSATTSTCRPHPRGKSVSAAVVGIPRVKFCSFSRKLARSSVSSRVRDIGSGWPPAAKWCRLPRRIVVVVGIRNHFSTAAFNDGENWTPTSSALSTAPRWIPNDGGNQADGGARMWFSDFGFWKRTRLETIVTEKLMELCKTGSGITRGVWVWFDSWRCSYLSSFWWYFERPKHDFKSSRILKAWLLRQFALMQTSFYIQPGIQTDEIFLQLNIYFNCCSITMRFHFTEISQLTQLITIRQCKCSKDYFWMTLDPHP